MQTRVSVSGFRAVLHTVAASLLAPRTCRETDDAVLRVPRVAPCASRNRRYDKHRTRRSVPLVQHNTYLTVER
jgi:hypothetical protein